MTTDAGNPGLAGVSWLNWVPAQYLRFVNAVLACIALGCCVLALSLFGTRWHANDKASDYSNLHQKWGHAPWSFLSGALSAAISIGEPYVLELARSMQHLATENCVTTSSPTHALHT